MIFFEPRVDDSRKNKGTATSDPSELVLELGSFVVEFGIRWLEK